MPLQSILKSTIASAAMSEIGRNPRFLLCATSSLVLAQHGGYNPAFERVVEQLKPCLAGVFNISTLSSINHYPIDRTRCQPIAVRLLAKIEIRDKMHSTRECYEFTLLPA